ncbi:MAG: nucleotide exchange factor GrpE [Proteobacteria bacterium]|nr:nucleotide exchange factor GrpE [Pseudomonadota bacterium]
MSEETAAETAERAAETPVDSVTDGASEETASDASDDVATNEPAEDGPTIEEQLEEARESIAGLKDKVLRALAETENLRRRGAKEKRDASQYAIANFARDLLSVGDNLGRALDILPEDAKQDKAFGSFVEGVELTGRELVSIFEKHGITEVTPHGEKFDHNLHQAMFEVEDTEKPVGTITEVMQIGYTIGDRLLRPAMVGVTKAPAPKEEPKVETPAEAGEAEVPGDERPPRAKAPL